MSIDLPRPRVGIVAILVVALLAMSGLVVLAFNDGRRVGERDMRAYAESVSGEDLHVKVHNEKVRLPFYCFAVLAPPPPPPPLLLLLSQPFSFHASDMLVKLSTKGTRT